MHRSCRHEACDEGVRRGLTLLELLVVISIVALLVGLLIPAIARVRGQSRATASAANARSLTQVIHAYADANRDYLPAFTEGESYPAMNRDVRVTMPYFQVANMWTGVVFDLLPYNQHLGVLLSPGSPRRNNYDIAWPTSYHYSVSFVADWRTWTPSGTADPRYLTHQKLSSTSFPSQKAMLWDLEASFLRTLGRSQTGDLLDFTPVAMADVSVSMRRPSDASEPITNPFFPPGAQMRLHNTENGLRGIDY